MIGDIAPTPQLWKEHEETCRELEIWLPGVDPFEDYLHTFVAKHGTVSIWWENIMRCEEYGPSENQPEPCVCGDRSIPEQDHKRMFGESVDALFG